MITLNKYSSEMHNEVLGFLKNAFREAGKSFEPEGRHAAFMDIEGSFIGFWCLFDDDKIIGTVAVKRLNEADCELKALYLYEKYHGRRLGYRMAAAAVDFARENGFKKMMLDTLSTYERAMRLYGQMGFVPTERYNDNQKADVFMALEL